MMLAEITITDAIVLACTVGMFVVALIALNKKQVVKVEQPLKVEQPVTITITEELHKVFASKDVFEKHVDENSKRHKEIFDKIESAKEGATTGTEQKIEIVRKDLVLVSNQVASLKSTTDMQNSQLTRMEHTLASMPSKIVADLVNAKKL